MAHMEKYIKTSVPTLANHFERNENVQEYSNKNIDPTRSHLNYNLAPEREMSQYEFVKQRCSEVKCLNRSDVKVMCSWVVTLPKDIEQNSAEEKKFFEETYKFLEERYGGSENVISAYVHKDEVTPHLHFAFVPVAYDKEKEIYKVSCKEVITKLDLRTFHTDLNEHIKAKLGREVEIMNESTKAGNQSVNELKAQTAREDLEKVQKELEEKLKELDNLKSEIKILDKLENEIDDVEKINYKNNKLSSKVSIEEKDFNNLKANIVSLKEENLKLKSINIKQKNQVDDLNTILKGQDIKLNNLEKSLKEKIYKLNEKSLKAETLNYNYRALIESIQKNEKVYNFVSNKMFEKIYKENKAEEKNIVSENKIDERFLKRLDDLNIKIDSEKLNDNLKNIFQKENYSVKEMDNIFLENCFNEIEKFDVKILLEKEKVELNLKDINLNFKNKSFKNQILKNKNLTQKINKEFKIEFNIQDKILNQNNNIKNTPKNEVGFDL